VAGGFLRKWFGKHTTPSQAVAEAQAELDRLAKDRPAFLEPISILRHVISACTPAEGVSLPKLDAEYAHDKLASGVPLLRGEGWLPDERELRRRWREICDVVEAASVRAGEPSAPRGRALSAAMRSGKLDPSEMVREVLAGRIQEMHDQVERLNLDPGLAATVLRFTLFPVLVSVSAELAPLREGVDWQHGYCPVCGSWPLLGEFRGLEQTRYLRCGLCAAEWEVPRLLCAFCGNRDHTLLGFLHVEGEETSYRVATCDGCHGYVKMLATLSALPPLQLLVADVATLHLDLVAAQRGYANPP
jgi:FdhE protein